MPDRLDAAVRAQQQRERMAADGIPTRAPAVELLEVGVGDRAEAAVVALAQQRLVEHARLRLGRYSRIAAARSV